jgi:hypothetical protein
VKLRGLDQRAKQYWLEDLAYKAIRARTGYENLKREGDPDKLEQLRAVVVKDMKTLGMDVQNLAL